MEKELQKKLEEIAFRLERLSNDYHELLTELSQMEEVKKAKKLIFEQYIEEVNTGDDGVVRYYIKSNINPNDKIVNICKSHYVFSGRGKYTFINKLYIPLSSDTTKIIETYIPSQNLVLVVEL